MRFDAEIDKDDQKLVNQTGKLQSNEQKQEQEQRTKNAGATSLDFFKQTRDNHLKDISRECASWALASESPVRGEEEGPKPALNAEKI